MQSTDSKDDAERKNRVEITYGKETMAKLQKLRVLIIGCRGLGVETAKNLILTGPGLVNIYDP
jgi:ubiquitin-activating enzyme E1